MIKSEKRLRKITLKIRYHKFDSILRYSSLILYTSCDLDKMFKYVKIVFMFGTKDF